MLASYPRRLVIAAATSSGAISALHPKGNSGVLHSLVKTPAFYPAACIFPRHARAESAECNGSRAGAASFLKWDHP